MRYYTTHILSANLELTPEGFLLAKNVPIARTGTMLYAPGEVPVPAKDGLVRIERTADEVFSPHTMASFEGKAVTLDHPSVDVGPANWSSLAKGIVQNVRRGQCDRRRLTARRLAARRRRRDRASARRTPRGELRLRRGLRRNRAGAGTFR